MKQTKIRTKASPALLVGVFLVVIGAAFGAVAFNALVPTILTPSSNTTVSAAIAPTGWTYVYGIMWSGGRKIEGKLSDLTNAIKNGADVKVYWSQDKSGKDGVQIICNKVSIEFINSETLVKCIPNVDFTAESLSADSLSYGLNSEQRSSDGRGMLYFVKIDKNGNISDSGGHGVGPQEAGSTESLKWFIKK